VLASEDESRTLAALRFSLASDIVELVVLTVDELFLQTLREGVGPARRLWHVLSPDKVSDLLVAGGVGILVLDVQALNEAAARFVADIKRQFPDLVVVVAGHREAETELARLISDGSIYRFIHKPMSPARARLFADAAVKRFDDRRRRIGEVSAPAPAAPSERRQILLAGAVAALAVLLIAAWFVHRRNAEQSDLSPRNAPEHPASSAPEPSTLRSADSAPALQGVLMEAQERLLAKARTALDQRRLDDAAATIETARKAGIATGRVAELATELAATRERAKSAPPAPAPAAPAPLVAVPATAPAAAPAPASTSPSTSTSTSTSASASAPAPTPAPSESGNDARAGELAKSARPSIAQDHLSEPEGDAARHDVDAALERRAFMADGVSAGQLSLVKSVQPQYPSKAEKNGVEGWVDLDFTVTDSGAVQDVAVVAAKPAGVFEAAATAALLQWRYAPLVRGAEAVAARARIRIRFTLAR
jgi:protein TonB